MALGQGKICKQITVPASEAAAVFFIPGAASAREEACQAGAESQRERKRQQQRQGAGHGGGSRSATPSRIPISARADACLLSTGWSPIRCGTRTGSPRPTTTMMSSTASHPAPASPASPPPTWAGCSTCTPASMRRDAPPSSSTPAPPPGDRETPAPTRRRASASGS